MKRLHSLMQLGRPTASQESDNTDGQVVTQPIEGAPVVQSQTEVMGQQAQAADAAQAQNAQTPADGSIPADGTGQVSQENNSADALVTAPVGSGGTSVPNASQDTGDGSKPASPSDQPGDDAARADKGKSVSQESGAGTVSEAPVGSGEVTIPNAQQDTGDGSIPATPADAAAMDNSDARADITKGAKEQIVELANEIEQQDPAGKQPNFMVTAPQHTDVAADPNNPQDGLPAEPVKSDEVPAAQSAASTEALSPEDVAQVAQVAAAAGAAAAAGNADTAIVDGANAQGDAAVIDSAAVAAETAANATDPAGAAAQTAADEVASAADSGDAPGPNAGDAAATPAEAAQVVADLIKDNPDNAGAIANAIDQVADASVAAADGASSVQDNADQAAANAQPDADAEANAAEEEQAQDEFNEAEEKKGEADDGLDDLDDLSDDVEVATESLINARELLVGLESIVEAALQNGGLSDDAAQILQKVSTHVAEQTDQPDDADLGLESLAYSDRLIATDYALGKLRGSIESLDADLQISTEGLFDIFRSTNAKTRSWISESRKILTRLKSTVDKDKTVTASVSGISDSEGFLEGGDRSLLALAGILKTHTDKVVNEAGNVAKIAERLRDGDADFDRARDDMDRITISTPSGNGDYDSGSLLGGVELTLSIDGTSSGSKLSKVSDSASVEISGANVITTVDSAMRLLGIMEQALRRFDEIERGAGSADSKGTGKFLAYGFLFSYFAFLSPDFRRRIGRVFSGDRQNDRVAELKASFDLSKNAMKASRIAVDEVISIAKKF